MNVREQALTVHSMETLGPCGFDVRALMAGPVENLEMALDDIVVTTNPTLSMIAFYVFCNALDVYLESLEADRANWDTFDDLRVKLCYLAHTEAFQTLFEASMTGIASFTHRVAAAAAVQCLGADVRPEHQHFTASAWALMACAKVLASQEIGVSTRPDVSMWIGRTEIIPGFVPPPRRKRGHGAPGVVEVITKKTGSLTIATDVFADALERLAQVLSTRPTDIGYRAFAELHRFCVMPSMRWTLEGSYMRFVCERRDFVAHGFHVAEMLQGVNDRHVDELAGLLAIQMERVIPQYAAICADNHGEYAIEDIPHRRQQVADEMCACMSAVLELVRTAARLHVVATANMAALADLVQRVEAAGRGYISNDPYLYGDMLYLTMNCTEHLRLRRHLRLPCDEDAIREDEEDYEPEAYMAWPGDLDGVPAFAVAVDGVDPAVLARCMRDRPALAAAVAVVDPARAARTAQPFTCCICGDDSVAFVPYACACEGARRRTDPCECAECSKIRVCKYFRTKCSLCSGDCHV